MKNLKRTKYYTMNSWNKSYSIAYNLKVYNVIDRELQDKVYDLMDTDDFYFDINMLIDDFNREQNFKYQAGFNGRSGGYLVLYKGGKKLSEHKSICTFCGQKNFTSIKENNNICGKCGKAGRIDKELFTIYTSPGVSLNENDIPSDVKKAFRQLTVDIVKDVEYKAKHYKIVDEEYTITKTRKVLQEV